MSVRSSRASQHCHSLPSRLPHQITSQFSWSLSRLHRHFARAVQKVLSRACILEYGSNTLETISPNYVAGVYTLYCIANAQAVQLVLSCAFFGSSRKVRGLGDENQKRSSSLRLSGLFGRLGLMGPLGLLKTVETIEGACGSCGG